ncbi:hypothetical protein ERJ75_001117000 [Trypanosoma vivax]|nr:hypothetical protein ERJ75_001117000 [Trypanosoma vivax]
MTRAPRRDSGEGTRFATKCDGVRARGAEQHTTWTTVAQLRVTRGAVSETSRQKFALGCLAPACLAARRRAEDRSRRERSSCIERRGRKGDSQSGLGTGEARAGERQGPGGTDEHFVQAGLSLFILDAPRTETQAPKTGASGQKQSGEQPFVDIASDETRKARRLSGSAQRCGRQGRKASVQPTRMEHEASNAQRRRKKRT